MKSWKWKNGICLQTKRSGWRREGGGGLFLIASQTRWGELQKVNIMRLNKASNLFSEALLIGPVQTDVQGWLYWWVFPFNKVGGLQLRVGCVPSVQSQVAVKMSCSPSEARTAGSIFTLTSRRQTSCARNYSFALRLTGSFARLAHENRKVTSKERRRRWFWLRRQGRSDSCFWSLSHAYLPGRPVLGGQREKKY